VSATVVMKFLTPVPFPSFLSSRHGTLVKEMTRHVCIAIKKNKEAHRALKTFFPPELPFLTSSYSDPVMPFPRPQPTRAFLSSRIPENLRHKPPVLASHQKSSSDSSIARPSLRPSCKSSQKIPHSFNIDRDPRPTILSAPLEVS
jgi:hypothetical protein